MRHEATGNSKKPKVFGIALWVFLLALGLSVQAQQWEKIPTIGIMRRTSISRGIEEFRQGMRALGYIEGKNIAFEYRFPEDRLEDRKALAADLVRQKVDVIVVGGPGFIRAAQQATRTIPIVMVLANDPVRDGFVASLARPGGNITGLSRMSPELDGKRLEVLKEAIPNLRRVAVLINPTNPSNLRDFTDSLLAARALGLELLSLEARSENDFDGTLASALTNRIDALVQSADALINAHTRRTIAFAMKHRLPTMHYDSLHVALGGLMSYGPSESDLFRRAATYVDRILKGANAADLPVEQPTKFELVINLKTAKQIGVTIPEGVLRWADAVIR
jgi:putative ABC transport system substrate-binding protein